MFNKKMAPSAVLFFVFLALSDITLLSDHVQVRF